jgi:hypothetical protein
LGGWFEDEAYAYIYSRPLSTAIRAGSVHIGTSELQGALELFRRVGPTLIPRPGGDGRVIFRIDNTQAVAAVNKGYSPAATLDAVARELSALAAAWNIDIVAVHIPGVINVKADALSRPSKKHPLGEPASAELALAPAVRVHLELRLGVRHTADAFADGLGAHVTTPRGCWLRNSFFDHPIQNEDWLIDPVPTLLDKLI